MRRVITGLFLILVFSSLQFGKVAVYILCKWENSVTGSTAPCDCEKHLISLNGNDGHDQNLPAMMSGLQSVKEFPPPSGPVIKQTAIIVNGIWDVKPDRPLPVPFLPSPFHPPAI